MAEDGVWIGVDLDGTLAYWHMNHGPEHIGQPIPKMVARVKEWLDAGFEVRIFTARVGPGPWADRAREPIEKWCLEHIGQVLPVTATKDFGMIELWDDRAIQVVPNTGETIHEERESRINAVTGKP